MPSRVCIKCKVTKSYSDFHANKRTSTGVHNVCKVCHNQASKERYALKGQLLRQQMANQRATNYEYRIEIERRSREKRKEVQRPRKNARQQIRNRLVKGSKFTILDKDLRKLYSQPCFVCEAKDNQSIDHIIPLARGGNHSIGNLMTLCQPCNASKGKRLLVEWSRYQMKVAGK